MMRAWFITRTPSVGPVLGASVPRSPDGALVEMRQEFGADHAAERKDRDCTHTAAAATPHDHPAMLDGPASSWRAIPSVRSSQAPGSAIRGAACGRGGLQRIGAISMAKTQRPEQREGHGPGHRLE